MQKLKIYFIALGVMIFNHCIGGSIGDSLEERSIVLNRLFEIGRDLRSPIYNTLYLKDDQADTNLLKFEIISNSNLYTVELDPGFELNISTYSYGYSSSGKSIMRHTGEVETITTFSPTIPVQPFSLTYNNFIVEESPEGYRGKVDFPLPLSVSSGSISFFKLNLGANLSGVFRTSEKTVYFSVNYPPSDFSIQLICPVYHNGIQPSKILTDFKISEIFKDQGIQKPVSQLMNNSTNLSRINLNSDQTYHLFLDSFLYNSVFRDRTCTNVSFSIEKSDTKIQNNDY